MNDVLGDRRAEFCHPLGKPRRYASAVQRKISYTRPFHNSAFICDSHPLAEAVTKTVRRDHKEDLKLFLAVLIDSKVSLIVLKAIRLQLGIRGLRVINFEEAAILRWITTHSYEESRCVMRPRNPSPSRKMEQPRRRFRPADSLRRPGMARCS